MNKLPRGFGLRRPSAAFGTAARSKAAEGRRTPGRWRDCFAKAVGCAALLVQTFAFAANGQSITNDASVRFQAVDIFVEAKYQSLAAYQLEFSVTNGNAKIVGIEGGEHRAFAEPPYYDPKAMQSERVVIAAFSTNAPSELPAGKTRVATIHLQTSGVEAAKVDLKLRVAADFNGNKIPAEAAFAERKAR